ncbi:putative fatty acyl-CoA reductase CG5065 [Centruroides sculpturatus]|uniref:putative fatty acyl-CoA reductase CG5065 n=1 Tax=Centruroides sculpturatus TaxID=218467 RepID=UPI000C6CA346|nr:putative fatty acyl-CoA reductase CG5065 [Centruroides sculpturatus]
MAFENSIVSEFYNDKCIFITGATGFMGKVMLEKLLRSCEGIKNIYVLMRQKRGKSPQDRIEDLFNCKAFSVLREKNPDSFKKVIMVAGDITSPNLGLCQSDIDLLAENVNIVFHLAATVRFDEPLKQAMKKNVLGTRYTLDVCQKFPHLMALIHVSTAYCHCDRKEIEETIYPASINLQKIIDIVDWMDEDTINAITPKLISGRPNTYTYTKALAENLLEEECGQLPVAIVRPSIVSSSWKEPFPGWVDNFNGPTGIIAAVSIYFYILPNEIKVYNNTSNNCITWDCVYRYVFPLFSVYPPLEVFRIPGGDCTTNRLWNSFRNIIDHYIPALIYDLISYMMGKKPMMINLYRKLSKALDSLEYFATNEWKFRCDNTQKLAEILSIEDRQTFCFDTTNLNWLTYWEESILGIRKYLFREDHASLPLARKGIKRLYYIGVTVRIMVMLGLFYFVFGRWDGFTEFWKIIFAFPKLFEI